MKKRLLSVLIAALIVVLCVMPAFASPSLLIDGADLLTADEEASLLATLEEISQRRQFDVVVVTTPNMGGMSAFEYAAAVYENYGYGQGENMDGSLFLISMAERECYIIGAGRGQYALNDSVIDFILDCVINDLSYGDYKSAFTVYAQMVDSYLDEEPEQTPGEYIISNEPADIITDNGSSNIIYDYGQNPTIYVRRFNAAKTAATSLFIGFVIALITVSIMKGKMKTVYSKTGAADYTRRGSMNLQRSNDIFLYRNVSRVRRQEPTQNRSVGGGGHISSSGHSYSGGGRKF